MTIEVTAKKADDAIKQGLEQLGATYDDVKIEVLDTGGIFRKARVRLTLETPEEESAEEKAPVEQKPAPAEPEKPEKAAPEKIEKAAKAEKPEKIEKAEKSAKSEKPERTEKPEKAAKAPAKAEKAPAKKAAEKAAKAPAKKAAETKNADAPSVGEECEKSHGSSAQNESLEQKPLSNAKNRRAKRPSDGVKEIAGEASENNTDEASEQNASSTEEGAQPAHKAKRRLRAEDREAANHALLFVKQTVALMGFESATVSADDDIEHIEITADGGDDSLIIGRHGDTLSALTYLAETCARAEKCHVNIVVDCNGYRARRAASLTAMAKRRARESAQKHRRIKLEPMDRTDRRTIHCALADDEYVTTASEGKEPYRYIVISPKNGEAYDYDEKRERPRRDRRGGKPRDGRSGGAPAGEKPRRAAFDINIHGFVGHNDPVPDEQTQEEPQTDEEK